MIIREIVDLGDFTDREWESFQREVERGFMSDDGY